MSEHSAVSRSAAPWSLPAWVNRFLPFLNWADRVNGGTLRKDLLAGLTGAIVVLPQGVAFATIAGMPPEYGLYAGMVPAIIAALFGSSWHLVSGPTTAASVVLFTSLSAFAEPGTMDYVSLALTLTMMVGVIQLTMGFARLGSLVNFISHTVIIGFTSGAAVVIAAKQVKHFFGIPVPSGSHVNEIIAYLITHVSAVNIYVFTVGLCTLLSGIAIKRWFPRFPYMIGAMLIGTLIAQLLEHLVGAAEVAIPAVGALPSSLPPLSSPNFSLSVIRDLAPTALAVTLFSLTEAVSIARSISIKSGQHLDGNQEFVGQGLSNIAGSFFSGYVATGSFNRSGLNYDAGAKTPLAAVFAGLLLMLIVLLVAPAAAYLPYAVMSGILFLVAWGLIDWHHIISILRSGTSETTVMLATFLSALFIDLEFSIFLGVILSLVLYLRQTSRPKLRSRVPDVDSPARKFIDARGKVECPQLKLLRLDGSIFYGAVSHINEQFRQVERETPEQVHVLLVATGINFIDVAGAEWLGSEAAHWKERGGGLYLLRPKQSVIDVLERGDFIDVIGRENIFTSRTVAIETLYQRLNRSICSSCDRAVFTECSDSVCIIPDTSLARGDRDTVS